MNSRDTVLLRLRDRAVSGLQRHLSRFGRKARDLDEDESGLLRFLRRGARDTTAQEIADTVEVSPGTVRNRIDQLEVDDIVRGYHPETEDEEANLSLRIRFVRTSAEEHGILVDRVSERKTSKTCCGRNVARTV